MQSFRFETMPSSPILHAWAKTVGPSPSMCSLNRMPGRALPSRGHRPQALSLHGSIMISFPLGPGWNEFRPAVVRVRTAKSAVAGDHLLHAHFVGWQTAIVMKGMARTSARAPRHLSGLADAKVEQHCHRYGHRDEHESHGRLHPDDTGRIVPRSLSSPSNALLPRGGKYKDRATFRGPPAKRLAQRKRLRPPRTLGRIDGEASQRLAAPSDVPHRHIGALDVAPQSIRIEQRTCLAVSFEFLPYGGDQPGIGRELQGQSLVFVETPSDEFGQTDGADQARSHPPDETLSQAREHRQSDPKRVARRGMRIDRKIVEEEVAQAVARQMLGYLRPWREHET